MNELNYGTLEACKKLAEELARKGIVIETEAAWCEYGPDDWRLGYRGLIEDDPRHRKFIPAYSMPEVWRELPDTFNGRSDIAYLRIAKMENGDTICGYHSYKERLAIFQNVNPADALIYLWAWVLEQEGKDGKGKA